MIARGFFLATLAAGVISSAHAAEPDLVVSRADFGVVAVGASALRPVTVQSTAKRTLTSLKASVGAPFSLAGGAYPGAGGTCGSSLAPGASCILMVAFTPVQPGAASARLTVSYGAAGRTATADVTGTGALPARLELSGAFDLGAVVLGTSSEGVLTVRNAGGVPATALAWWADGPFQVAAGSTCATSLAAGSSCTVPLRFAPTARGPAAGAFTVSYQNGVAATSTSAPLAGAGLAPARLVADPLSMPAAIVGGFSTGTAVLTNAGDVEAIGLDGALDGPFAFEGGRFPGLRGTCGPVLAPGASCAVSVEFHPAIRGPAEGSLALAFDGGAGPDRAKVPVAATGLSPALLRFEPLHFGSVMVGQRSVKTVWVWNEGDVEASQLRAAISGPFGLVEEFGVISGGTCVGELPAFAGCRLLVEFKPTAAGPAFGALELRYFDGLAPRATTASLVGDGDGFGPDLVVTAVKGPPSVTPRSAFTAEVTVCNQGPAPGAAQVDLVLSTDATLVVPVPPAPLDPTADRPVGGSFFQLDPGRCLTQRVQGVADPPAPGTDGAYYLGAVADFRAFLPELDETNNASPASLIGIGFAPDLVVTAVKGPPSATPGSTFTAEVTVCNQGTAPGAGLVDLVLSSDSTPSNPIDPASARLVGQGLFQPMPGGCETQRLQGIADPPAPGVDGAYYLGAIADLPNLLPELIETNNAGPASVVGIGYGPDLVVARVKGPPSVIPGGAFTAEVTVCNQGTAPGGAQVDLVLSVDASLDVPISPAPWDPAADRPVGGGFFAPWPGACETQTLVGVADPPAPVEGAYWLGAIADRWGSLPELVETNNASAATLVGIGWGPDLVVSAVKAPPSVAPGAAFTAAVTVCNQGTASGGAQVDLVLSADSTLAVPATPAPWDPDADRLVGGSFFQLEAGACQTRNLDGYPDRPGPGLDGEYYLGAIADRPNALPELVETNNVGPATRIGIGWGPDLVVAAVKGPPSLTPGAGFTAAVTVCNQGTTVGGAQVDLVVSADSTLSVQYPPSPWEPAADRLVGGSFFELEAGACQTQDLQGWADRPEPVVDGAYHLGAIADVRNMLPELVETNNAGPATVVGIGWGPDLVVTAVRGPPSVLRGGAFTAELTVCNQGTAPGGAEVALVLSKDAALDPPAPPSGQSTPSSDQLLPGGFFQLDPGACQTWVLESYAHAPEGLDGAYYLGAVADPFGALPELVETNNASPAALIGVGVGPDLVVAAVDGPPSVLPGAIFTADVTVCNQGTAAGAAQVDLVLSADATLSVPVPPAPWDPTSDRLVGGAFFQLDAGACRTQRLQGVADPPEPFVNGAYHLGAIADVADAFFELVETNNASPATVIGIGSGPDLVVAAVKGPPSVAPDGAFTAEVTVCNQGTAPGAAQVDLVVSADRNLSPPVPPAPWLPDSDRLVGGAWFEVQPGACRTANVQGNADRPAPGLDGAYYLGAVADVSNALAELVETNNASPATPIGIGWAPDLVVVAVKGPASVAPGAAFTAEVTVCNQGTAAGGAQVDLVVSADGNLAVPVPPAPWFPESDRPVGGAWFQLAPGGCQTGTIQGFADRPAPATDGAYWLGAIADLRSSLPELVETNNASPASVVGIGWGPDLVVTAVQGPPSVVRGAPFTAAVTVCNQGTASGSAQVDLVLSADSTLSLPFTWDPSSDQVVGGAFFALEPGACETRSIEGTAHAPAGLDGAYYVGAVADLSGATPELVETNNASSAGIIGIGWGPDLVVTAVGGPPSVLRGAPFAAAVTVCNQGTAFGGAQVDLVLSADSTVDPSPAGPWDPTSDRPVGGAFFQLEAGACETQTVQGVADPPAGPDGAYHLAAVADVTNALWELVETNNASPATVIGIGWGPDLVVTAVDGPPSVVDGNPFTAAVTVCNQGTAFGAAQVDLVLSTDSTLSPAVPGAPWDPAADRLVGAGSFQLEPGACQTRNLQGTADRPWADGRGAYYLGAVADVANALPELIETNNASPATLIGIGWGPDLVVSAVTGPPSVLRGNTFTAAVTVCNQGTAFGAAQVDLVLSVDSTLSVPGPSAPWDPAADRLVGGSFFELQPGACRTQDVQGFADPPAPGVDGAYYLGAVADVANALPELIETNNASAAGVIGVGWGPDLVVTAVNGPASVLPGNAFTAAVTVCNQGTAFGGAQVDLVLSNDSTLAPPAPGVAWDPAADRLVGGSFFQLEAGACRTQDVQGFADVPAPGLDGAYYLGAVADVWRSVPELVETNNLSPAAVIGVGWGPDLVVSAVTGPPSAPRGSAFTAAVTVCNQGTAFGAAQVELVVSADSTLSPPAPGSPWDPAADRLVGGSFFQLEPGACQTQDVQGFADVPAPGVDGAYYLGAVADAWRSVPELVETNNASPASVIGIGWGPDLVVTAVSGPPSAPLGSGFTAAVTVCNQGTAFGAAQVELVLSTDSTLAPPPPGSPWDPDADRMVGGSFFQLEPGACQTQDVQGFADPPAPGVDGAYYLGAVADATGWLSELVETNNLGPAAVIGIGFGPDFFVAAVAGPPSVEIGGPFTAEVTVCNQGTAPSGAQVDLVLSADSTLSVPVPPVPWDPASDRLVGGAFFQPAPGTCETQTVQGWADLPAPGGAGTYYLGAIADVGNSAYELVETNNVSASSPIDVGG